MSGRLQNHPRRGARHTAAHRWGLLLILLVPLAALPAMGRAQGPNRAGVVVQMGDGQVHTACVSFTEPTISGLALLERSGLDVIAQPSAGNATICSIGGEGCSFPRESCFCQCQGGGTCRYWTYWHLAGGVWQYASTGAAAYRVSPGSVDGWAWGNANAGGSRPPEVSFGDICPDLEPGLSTPTTTLLRPTATRAPLSKAQPTAELPAATPMQVAATPTRTQAAGAERPASGSSTGRYLLLGGMLGTLLTAIGLAARRRR